MATKAIFEILDEFEKVPKSDEERAQFLRDHDSTPLRTILQFAFDDSVKSALPPGTPPYTPTVLVDSHLNLYQAARTLYIFCVGGADNVSPIKRETLFISMLENVHPEDAKILIHMKDKMLARKGLKAYVIADAFPGLLREYREHPNMKTEEEKKPRKPRKTKVKKEEQENTNG